MKKLEELLEIIDKALPGPWHIGHISEIDGFVDVDAIDSTRVAEDVSQMMASYLCAFDPINTRKLVMALILTRQALANQRRLISRFIGHNLLVSLDEQVAHAQRVIEDALE